METRHQNGQRRGTATTAAIGVHNPQRLRQQLSGHQIYFIVLSLVIGSGVFNNNGEVLRLAGPMGLLVAVLLFGTVAVCVGETVAELVQLFPVPNAIFEYVDTFVDRDVAWAVGVLYWYTYASIFPFQILNAAKHFHFWIPQMQWQRIFSGIIPFLLLAINLVDVVVFGWIETISGAIKLALVFVISVLLYRVADQDISGMSQSWDFEHDARYANSPGDAFCYGLPLVAFSYIGIEAFAMAAFEARRMSEVRFWSKLTHWTVLVAYFLCTVGIILTVNWKDEALPQTHDPALRHPSNDCPDPRTTSAVVIGVSKGMRAFGHSWDGGPCGDAMPPPVAAAVNGILLFTTLSAANASLYVSSRTLYGLTYQRGGGGPVGRWLQRTTGVVWPRTGAPAMALFMSLMAFYGIIYLAIVRGSVNEKAADGATDFMHIVAVSLSVSALIVWATICLAHIRFHRWTHKCRDNLANDPRLEQFLRTSRHYGSQTILSWLQPYAAYYVFLMCLVIFVFVSATMWKTGVDGTKFMAAYLPHILLVVITAGRKLYYLRDRHARGWVRMQTDRGGAELIRKLRALDNLSERAADRRLDDEQGPPPPTSPSPPPEQRQQQFQHREDGAHGRRHDSSDQRGFDDELGPHDQAAGQMGVQMMHVRPEDSGDGPTVNGGPGWNN